MIRAYVWADGVAAAGVFIATAFWCGLLIDWFFEPPVWARVLLLAAIICGLLAVFVNRIVMRLSAPLGDANMALLLERRFPRLDDSLLTAVELSGDFTAESEGLSSTMLARTSRRAEKRLAALSIGEVIDRGPLRRRISLAGGLLLSLVLFAFIAPQALGVWARRSLLLSDELWPRSTRLLVEGFENGTKKVARGSDVEIAALADCAMPLVPKTVEVRYRAEGGSHRRAVMNREGNAAESGDDFQRYTYTLHGVLAPIELEIRGGDAEIGGLRLEVVESPTIEELSLECEFPAYMNRSPRRLPVIGTVTETPYGTRVRVHGRCGKDLRQVAVDESEGPRQKPRALIEMPGGAAAPCRWFAYDLGEVREDRTVSFNLLDSDGIRSRQPLQLVLAVKPDEPPELPVVLLGIGSAITPQARLPVEGRVSDDYGIARLWFEYAIDKSPPATLALAEPQGNPAEIALAADETALEVRDLGVAAGQKLLVGLKAADRFDRGEAPNEGSSQRWLLDVVAPARLQAILQARELLLRQHFEATVEEVRETRDSLSQIDFQKSGGGDKDAAAEDRASAIRELRCDRAIQNCLKNAHEVSAAAQAFDDVRLQLINNRIDTEETRSRLQAGIVEPLERIAEQMFPRADSLLRELRGAVGDAETGPQKRDLAKTQLDAILSEMNAVLGRMLELEDYSQAIAILRSIIDAQKKLGEQMKQRHKAKLHKLLEE